MYISFVGVVARNGLCSRSAPRTFTYILSGGFQALGGLVLMRRAQAAVAVHATIIGCVLPRHRAGNWCAGTSRMWSAGRSRRDNITVAPQLIRLMVNSAPSMQDAVNGQTTEYQAPQGQCHELRHMLYTARMPLNASRSASNLEHLSVPVSAGPDYHSDSMHALSIATNAQRVLHSPGWPMPLILQPADYEMYHC